MTKVVLFWAFYPKYLQNFYKKNLQLGQLTYQQQLDAILYDYFGWPLALMKKLEERDCEVAILITNALPLQRAWARENGCQFDERSWQYDIPVLQVKNFRPDIIWIGSMFKYYGSYLNNLHSYCKKIFAWVGSPVPSNLDLSDIDCLLTSHQNFKDYFEERGKKCEILLPAFEPKILNSLQARTRDIECSFIGSLSYIHLNRMRVIEKLCKSTSIKIWSDLPRLVSKGIFNPNFLLSYIKMMSISNRFNPSAWGIEMYNILARSKMTVNVHVDAASGLSGNIRMFEATGVGALLITENSPNIRELYQPGQELVTYENTSNLIEVIEYYTNHPKEREMIAKAGQERTLTSHNTLQRSQELMKIFERYL
jgi:spore maturation protein CgeB